jgi:hypothetical protein
MLQKSENYLPGYHFRPKNKEVIINNWGKTKEEFLNEYNNDYYNINKSKNKSFDINSVNSVNSFNTLNPIEKAKIIIKPTDCMNKFLTDEQNENEVNSYFMRQKQNKQNFYKDLLYSQYVNNVQKNKNIFGTEDMLILKEKKKKLITENPYRQKNEYDFGDSKLENNPILNPENNMKYNKYFKDFYSDNSNNNNINDINDINNSNNTNKIKNSNINIEVNDCNNNFNDYKYNNENNNIYNNNNYNTKKDENNFAVNGSNIMNNYKFDFSKYKIKNNGLSRNFSDIYSRYKTYKNDYNINSVNNSNINNNNGYRHKFLNNSNRSFSQIQI